MVKVLIYGSKEIYDNATYEGRAEAHFVAYRKDDGYYEITKNRTGRYLGSFCSPHTLNQEFEWMERDEWDQDVVNHILGVRYKDHPNVELMKNSA
jgi:hypothetical protein